MGFIINLLISALAVIISSYIIPGVQIDSMTTAVLVALVLGILNAIVKPILIILTLPITIITLGLFSFVINALIILLAGSVVSGFHVDGFISALLFSLVLSVVSSLLGLLTK